MQPRTLGMRSAAFPLQPQAYSFGFWVAACYMVLFIIRPWELLFPQLGDFKFERIYVAFMLIAVLKEGFRLHGQYKSVLGFFAAIVFSAVLAQDTALAWDSVYRYLPQVVFFVVLLSVIRQQRELNLMIGVFLAALAMYTGKAHWEYYIHDAHRVAQGVDRLMGIDLTETDPNAFAMHMVCSLPLVLYQIRNRKAIIAQSPAWVRPFILPGLVVYGLLAISTVFHTQSRAGMLGLAAFFFLASFSFVRGGKIVRAIALSLVLVGVAWLVLPETVKGRLRTIWNPDAGPANAQTSAEGRINGLKAGLEMFRRHPINGVGPGNFMPYRIRHVDGVPLIAHNLPGQVLGELGLIGGLAFAILAIVAYRNTRRTRNLAGQFPGNPQMRQHEQLANACRQVILLLLFFGMALHNNLKYDWLWVAAFAGLNLQFTKVTAHRLTQIGRRRMSQSGMSPQYANTIAPR